MTKLESYNKGFIDGLTAYAWWKDGRQEVGTTGTTLKEAIKSIKSTWNYDPPKENENGRPLPLQNRTRRRITRIKA